MARMHAPPKPLEKASLTLTRHSSVMCDFDGLVTSFKNCIDGLVLAKIILDDSPQIIGIPVYKQVKTKPKQGFITIKVEGEYL